MSGFLALNCVSRCCSVAEGPQPAAQCATNGRTPAFFNQNLIPGACGYDVVHAIFHDLDRRETVAVAVV